MSHGNAPPVPKVQNGDNLTHASRERQIQFLRATSTALMTWSNVAVDGAFDGWLRSHTDAAVYLVDSWPDRSGCLVERVGCRVEEVIEQLLGAGARLENEAYPTGNADIDAKLQAHQAV